MLQNQKTIKNSVSCFGVGLHSGAVVNLTLKPAAVNSGIIFKRTDITDKNNEIPANYQYVTKTTLGTTICNEDGVEVSTIEHLMAAFWGCGIDNVIVEIDAAEIPIMDGSSCDFVFLIECAKIVTQEKPRRFIEILKPISTQEKDAFINVTPHHEFSINMVIDFDHKVIQKQERNFIAKDLSFKMDLSRARTFGFVKDVEKLQSIGLARGGSLKNAIVIDEDKVLNEEGLRYEDEFVRHKLLDSIGDLYLAGAQICGKFEGFKTGHGLNNKILRTIFADHSAWRMVQN